MPVKLIRIDGGRPVELGRHKTRAAAVTVARLLAGPGSHWSSDKSTLIAPDGARYKIDEGRSEMISSLQPTFRHYRQHGTWEEEASFRDAIEQARVIPAGRYLKFHPEFGDLKMVGICIGGVNTGQWAFGGTVQFRSNLDYSDGAISGAIAVPPAERKYLIAGRSGATSRLAWVLECEDMQEMEAWFNDHARPVTQRDKRPTTRW